MAITWSTVTAPSQTSAVGFAELGANQIQQGIAGLADLASNIAQKEIADRQRVKDVNTETALNVINSIGNEDDLTNAKSQLTLDNLNKLYGNQINAGSILSALQDKQKSLRQDALSAQQFEINTNNLNEQKIQQQDTALLSQAKQLAAAGKFDDAYALSSQTSDPALITNAVNAVKYQPVYTDIERALSIGDYKTAGQLIKDNPDLPNALKYSEIISSQSDRAFDRSMESARFGMQQQEFNLKKLAAQREEQLRLQTLAKQNIVAEAAANITTDNFEQVAEKTTQALRQSGATASEINGMYDVLNQSLVNKTGGNAVDVRNAQAAVKFQSGELDREITNLEESLKNYIANNKYSPENIAKRRTEGMDDVYTTIREVAPSETFMGATALANVDSSSNDIGGADAIRLADELLRTKVVAVPDANKNISFRAALPTDANEAQYIIEPWMIRDAAKVARDTADPYLFDPEIRTNTFVQHVYMLAVESAQQSAAVDAEIALRRARINEKKQEKNKLDTGGKNLKEVPEPNTTDLLNTLKNSVVDPVTALFFKK